MTDEDRPQTAAARAGRLAALPLRPFVWTFALLGVAFALFPAYPLYEEGGSHTVTALEFGPLDRVKVEPAGVAYGYNYHRGQIGPWHPVVLHAEVLGGPATEEDLWGGAEPFAHPTAGVHLNRAVATPSVWLDDDIDDDRLTDAERAALEEADRYRTVFELDLTLWAVLAPAAVSAVLLLIVGLRAGREPRPPGLPRRLVCPWLATAAAVGAAATASAFSGVGPGPGEWHAGVHLQRGPSDTPHPRLIALSVVWPYEADPAAPAPETADGVSFTNRTAGVWFEHERRPLRGDRTGVGDTFLSLSLWWLALPAVLINLLTRRRRAGRAAA